MNYFCIPGYKMSTDNISAERIIFYVSSALKVKIEDMISHCRKRPFSDARHLAMFLIRKHTGMTLLSIGQLFGNRDHTSVLHGIRLMDHYTYTEQRFKRIVADIDVKL